ncbi:MAG: hypothetical protein A2381_19360 [Bdellovibrionales bacterium RIFOXYB1_FULL_37_110]|nr:MAG: hypothetical protein A2381_19360 [Bdellovibrionales bacterium RIFOXYB1_FULL_37_110]
MGSVSGLFAEQLNASSWMGVIYEAGFGIPFQANYLNIPGASKTILKTGCNYHKILQPIVFDTHGDRVRSVSREMAEKISQEKILSVYQIIIREMDGAGVYFRNIPNLFSLVVSGSQSGVDCKGDSHGWVSLSTITTEGYEGHSFHFFNHKEILKGTNMVEVSREEVGSELCKFIEWFMSKILLKKWATWKEAIAAKPNSQIIEIDVINSKDIEIAEHLMLVNSKTLLVYHNGSFQRPIDYLRKYKSIFRGSFNPPTKAHIFIGDNALFEISMYNNIKGHISSSDVAQRLIMLDTLNVPVLITDNLPYFVELNSLLVRLGGKGYQYIIGTDIFNLVISDRFNPTEHFMQSFYRKGGLSSFLVIPRFGFNIETTPRASNVNWSVYNPECDLTVSSSRVRDGEIDLVPELIRKMVVEKYNIGEK